MVKLLREKSEAAQNVIDFIKMIKTQHGSKTKKIRCDNGGEFSSSYIKTFCRSKGIQIQYTTPFTPQQNGTSERMNRTLINMVRTKFAETNLPRELWGEAIRCSAYELNRCPTSANNGVPPAERWYGKNDLSKLRVFGSRAWRVKLPKQNKLDLRAESTIMIGYSSGGYRLWNNEQEKIICSRDIIFDETDVRSTENKENITKGKFIGEDEESTDETQQSKDEVNRDTIEDEKTISKYKENTEGKTRTNQERTNKRQVKIPGKFRDYELYTAYCLISEEDEPKNYEEAMKSDHEWKQAIND